MKVGSLVVVILCITLSKSFALTSEEAIELWGLSPLKSTLRHPFEGAAFSKDKTGQPELQLRVWYESKEPEPDLICRALHTLLYGRHKSRARASLPLSEAFQKNPNLQKVELTYFSLQVSNKPISSDDRTRKKGKGLRVNWVREDKVIPYLSVTISNGEWKTLGRLVSKNAIAYPRFRTESCAHVVSLVPTIRSDFSARGLK